QPVYNAAPYLEEALASVAAQTHRPLQLCCYDDGSTDGSGAILDAWRPRLAAAGIDFVLRLPRTAGGPPSGSAGFSRNRCIEVSCGPVICHLDADDAMAPGRVTAQLAALRNPLPAAIIGAQFCSVPEAGSMLYYTRWLNGLSPQRLLLEQYRECTVISPTWMYRREAVWDAVGGFNETPGAPEDLVFFLEHMARGGTVVRVDSEGPLVNYRSSILPHLRRCVFRHVPGSYSRRINKRLLQRARIPYLERRVLSGWPQGFTIWGYGRDGRRFFSDLSPAAADSVVAFCDVAAARVGMTHFCPRTRRRIPIVHFSAARPPLIVCVGSKIFGGEVERNVATLDMREGADYYHFC
ncbi:unnamed protein product, partial [Phaeothamnion confervicola]